MISHSVCEGCPNRHAFCRPNCEKWQEEQAMREKEREKKRKDLFLKVAFVDMNNAKYRRLKHDK